MTKPSMCEPSFWFLDTLSKALYLMSIEAAISAAELLHGSCMLLSVQVILTPFSFCKVAASQNLTCTAHAALLPHLFRHGSSSSSCKLACKLWLARQSTWTVASHEYRDMITA